MPEPYKGEERRRRCVECVSHREHTAKLDHLKSELIEIKADMRTSITTFKTEIRGDGKIMWDSIKAKVPYVHFISGLTIVITAIGIVTGINWTTMTRVLDSNHRVELQMTALQAEFKTIGTRMIEVERQLDVFRKQHIQITQEMNEIRTEQKYNNQSKWNIPKYEDKK
jgi:hypothetical protein